jgi:CubicO group peptidase (beta-lactamase class C family)
VGSEDQPVADPWIVRVSPERGADLLAERNEIDAVVRRQGLQEVERITIQQLLAHQSGLPRDLNGVEGLGEFTQGDFVERARQEQLEFEPGTG